MVVTWWIVAFLYSVTLHVCCVLLQEGRSPLYYAAQMGFTTICRELIEHSANINHRDIEKK